MRPLASLVGLMLAGCWGATEPPAVGRQAHTATSLRDTDLELPAPDVVVVGGCAPPCLDGSALASTEFYDQDTNQWSAGPNLTQGRFGHAAVRLRNNSVLIVGGAAGSPTGPSTDIPVAAERLLFSPLTGIPPRWLPAGVLGDGRLYHTATLLPDGQVLVVGGLRMSNGESLVASAELWDPAVESFVSAEPPASPRYFHTATALPDGSVMIAGGFGPDRRPLPSTEIYDSQAPPGTRWRPGPSLPIGLAHHAASLIGGGRDWKVVVTGGAAPDAQASTLVASVTPGPPGRPDVGPWSRIGDLTVARWTHATAIAASGHLLVIGGLDATGQATDSVEVLDPQSWSWVEFPTLQSPRGRPTASALAGGRLLVAGGTGAATSAEITHYCDPEHCTKRIPSCLCPDACPDSDGDGLSDAWEREGIDTNADGVIDVTAGDLGADPARPDLFVEIDYMVKPGSEATCPLGPDGLDGVEPRPGCFKPFTTTLDTFRRVYQDLGFNVHLDVAARVPYQSHTTHGGCLGAVPEAAVLADVKNRHSPAWRRGIHHYALFGDVLCDQNVSTATGLELVYAVGGFGEVNGDDVTISGRETRAGVVVQTGPVKQARALIHEIGHNLGLLHDGPPSGPIDAPNYTSVMGGKFLRDPDFDADDDLDVDEDGQVTLADVTAHLARVDFSPGGLGALDEAALDERSGVPGAALPFAVQYSCPPVPLNTATDPKAACDGAPGPFRRACKQLKAISYLHDPGGPHQRVDTWLVVVRNANQVDWNCDGKFDSKVIQANINNTWRYPAQRSWVELTTTRPCAKGSDCLGGVCDGSQGVCLHDSFEVESWVPDQFPGYVDPDHFVPPFQCYTSADIAGEDLPVFSAP